jgi:uncharacterized membrane protein
MPTSFRPTSADTRRRRALFPGLMTFPASCFLLTLIFDIAYACSANMMWESTSVWLLTIGLIAGALFVVVGLIEAFGLGRWPTMTLRIGYAIALILSIFNAFIHSRDGYTSVVPTGLTLSIIVALVLLATWILNLFAPRRAARWGEGS